MHIWTCWNFLSSPGQWQLGIDLHPKLSLRIQLISPKYNNLVLGSDMAWYACPWGLLVNSFNWGGFVKDLYYLFLVSSPEPKAYWWAYRIGHPSVCRPRSLNIFSSETARPISQISYGASMGWGNESLFKRPRSHDQDSSHAHIWQNLKKSFSPEPKGWWHWNLVCSIGCLNTTKFVQMMNLGWPWPILQQGQMCSLKRLYGKKVKQWIFQKPLSSMVWH